MTDDEIVLSLKTLAESAGAHPPTLGQFVAASKPPPSGSPRYLGKPTTPAEVRAALPPPGKVVRDFSGLRRCLHD